MLKYFLGKLIDKKVPKVNSNRCINQIQKKYRCNICEENCPSGAIHIGEKITIDENLCKGCYICTVVCPNSCFTSPIDYKRIFYNFNKKDTLLIGCSRNSKLNSGLIVPCLAGLPWELYASFGTMDNKKLHIDISLCNQCSKSNGHSQIKAIFDRVKMFLGEDLFHEKFIFYYESSPFKHAVSRREIFGLFNEKSAQVARGMVDDFFAGERHSKHPGRELLLKVLEDSNKKNNETNHYFWSTWVVEEECWACGICEKICPNSAWENKYIDDTHREMIHYPLKCKECGLCSSLCPSNALKYKKIVPLEKNQVSIGHLIPAGTCSQCKRPMKPGEKKVCSICE